MSYLTDDVQRFLRTYLFLGYPDSHSMKYLSITLADTFHVKTMVAGSDSYPPIQKHAGLWPPVLYRLTTSICLSNPGRKVWYFCVPSGSVDCGLSLISLYISICNIPDSCYYCALHHRSITNFTFKLCQPPTAPLAQTLSLGPVFRVLEELIATSRHLVPGTVSWGQRLEDARGMDGGRENTHRIPQWSSKPGRISPPPPGLRGWWRGRGWGGHISWCRPQSSPPPGRDF